ncbi:dephospho-CoA kinase [Puniceibacterium sp. IMCC21224]|uniref:dephospho-CoA kinase n=1 Tax=Puniceibacterium sp. IMCC21224 TaxID=1618204 RepID=UPI00064DE516|nr:dephospho-CoA kinase [Puniceibacterium sp. IMCC21224]KMK65407.1 dephospho-CoA kinase [Puniceibacterium sp. IMCC21224]
MRFRLGLTGSIGMGKSTTAAMFVDRGCVLWDADAAVHRLYTAGGAAVGPIQALFPAAISDASVDRAALRQIISETPNAITQIEAIVHPLVQADRAAFVADMPEAIGVFDIPLLFESGADREMDAVACVTVAPDIQRKRVLARSTMSAEQFNLILARQMPVADKIARSDYVIETETLEAARQQVQSVLRDIERQLSNA